MTKLHNTGDQPIVIRKIASIASPAEPLDNKFSVHGPFDVDLDLSKNQRVVIERDSVTGAEYARVEDIVD